MSPEQFQGRLIVAGHACLDLTPPFLPDVPMPGPGELAEVGPAEFSPGGAVSNVGLAAARVGAPVRLISHIGQDLFGEGLRKALSQPGVDLHLKVVAEQPTSYSIVISPPGHDRRFLHAPGANHTFAPEDDVTDAQLAGGLALHFGYPPAMRRTYEDGGASLARLFARAKRSGLRTSLDMCHPGSAASAEQDWHSWLGRVLPVTDCFCPSLDELRILLRLPDADEQTMGGMCHQLGAAAVCIKLGDQGLYFSDGTRTFRQQCLDAHCLSANGAGDCTIAGLIVARLCGYDWPAALRLACAVGAFSVESTSATGGVPPWADVLRRANLEKQ